MGTLSRSVSKLFACGGLSVERFVAPLCDGEDIGELLLPLCFGGPFGAPLFGQQRT